MTPQKDHIERESFPNYNEPSVSQRDGNVLRLLKSARNMRIQLSSMDDDEGPAGLCKRGSCRHSSLVPIYKSPKFKQTAAGQAPTMLSGGKRGARLELPAQQWVWWEMQLKEQPGKPNTCQALSHSSVARRSIKMSLSLSCWWLYYPLHWLLVIKKKKKQISFLHCSGLPLAFFKQ